jgi:hypothetical protein
VARRPSPIHLSAKFGSASQWRAHHGHEVLHGYAAVLARDCMSPLAKVLPTGAVGPASRVRKSQEFLELALRHVRVTSATVKSSRSAPVRLGVPLPPRDEPLRDRSRVWISADGSSPSRPKRRASPARILQGRTRAYDEQLERLATLQELGALTDLSSRSQKRRILEALGQKV